MGSPAATGSGLPPPAGPAFRHPFQNGKLMLAKKAADQSSSQTNSNFRYENLIAKPSAQFPRFNDNSRHPNSATGRVNNGSFGLGHGHNHNQMRTPVTFERTQQQQLYGSYPNEGGSFSNSCRNWNNNNKYPPHNQYHQYSNGYDTQEKFPRPFNGARFQNRWNNRPHPYNNRNDNQQRGSGPRFQNQNGTHNDKPWVTPELKEMIHQRNALQKRAQLFKNPGDWQEFKDLRQKVTSLLNAAKFDYEIKLTSQPKSERIFYCDTCDKTCLNQKGLDEHNAEHIVCKLDGCVFTAHPKVVLKHIQMQHATNLFHRIKGYKTEEEIKLWIDERKKNFPTTTTLKRKKAAASERHTRGERIPKTPKFRYPINQAQKIKDKYKNGQSNNRNGSITNNPLMGALKYDNKDYIHAKNTSEIVTLENYYALVKVGDKRKLIGKKLTLWSQPSTFKKLSEEVSEKSSDEEDGSEAPDLSITDEEEDPEAETLDYETATSAKTCFGDAGKVPSSTSVSGFESVNKASSGLAGLLLYASGTDSDSDGEIQDSDSDDEPPEEIKTQRKLSFPSNNEQMKSRPQTNSQHDFTNSPIQKNHANQSKKEFLKRDTGIPKGSDQAKGIQAKVGQTGTKRHQYHRVQKLRKFAMKKAINSEKDDCTQTTVVCGKDIIQTPDEPTKDSQRPYISSGKGWTGNKAVRPQLKPRPRWRAPTLLERLLAEDIEKEGNYLLQGCRFIVENNFFETADDPNSKSRP